MRIDRNKLAREITLAEGKKVSLPVGQVKEVLRLTLESLSRRSIIAVWRLLQKVRRENRKSAKRK